MDDALNCPVCGTAIQQDSSFCRKCGGKIVRCPDCGVPLPPRLMYCPKCNASIETTTALEEPVPYEDGFEKPYMVWEGWPFATLAKMSQTRGQWRITLILTVAAMGILVLYWALIMAYAPADERCCLGGFLGVLMVFVLLMLLIRYRAGREGAGG
ncbi:MAG TPA: zinc ribbon domain-containing protein [Candidatus Paceibacterota bacterium]|nr:zinc ribbon domain-containing protein [Candidatus Paceibacterota bacterium]